MKFSTAAACALAALFALTAQVPAAPPPVTLTWCAFSNWTLAPVGAGGQLPVRFTVTGGTPVTDVHIRMLWADRTFSVVNDAGTFAPGSDIHHTLSFEHYGEITGEMLQHLDLVVESVRLANGTVWKAPAAGAPAVRCDNWFGR
jgi:hypothetical protein